MKPVSATIMFLTFLLAAVSAQSQMPAPKPGPELKKLDYFVGTWTMDGDLKPGPMGPGGKMTGTEHIEWMDGGFFLTSHSNFKSAMGNGTGLAVMGYNADDKVYTYDEYNSVGDAEHSKGTVDGDTWTWSSDEKMGGQTMKARFTMKILSPTSYSFKYEMSPDGTNWSTVMDGKSTKSK
jgi:hypothetical protein